MSHWNPEADRDDPKLRQILDSAADLPADRRAAFLDEACAGDGQLRLQVDSLLDALVQAEGFLANPTVGRAPASMATAVAEEGQASQIGPYKLLQKIGEGGMGVVYMAEQQRPVVRRVAIKIIKLGMDTRQVIARFEAERQALALMDHPNIARVLDAGATDTGRPYFVMELVRGVSITEYCDTNHLSTRQRLELFLPVCRAVQHAHQKGIIHRDIKPSNVLITMHDGMPVPKVIDFGIAKATSGRLTDKTLFTQYHQFVGTPQYMSPEQAEMSGLDIDTRADVYALGVLLYELLTGTTPFDEKTLRQAAYAEIQRIIREVEPPKPSTRLSTLGETLTTVAAHRGVDPRKLSALMRGDLDWIVMKCLEKDRTRRYETANELGVEIQRHLNNDTVLARPTSAAYRVKKFVRRHKLGVAAATAIAVTLILGIIGTTYGLLRANNETANARKQTERATQEAHKARAVTDFVQEMLASADPMKTSRNDITVRQVIDEAVRKLDSGSLNEQPGVESAVRLTLGVTYNGVGKLDQAELQLRKALALVEKVYGPESPEAGSVLYSLGGNYTRRSRPEAIDLLRKSLKIRQKCFGNNSREIAQSQMSLGGALNGLNHDNPAAEIYLRESLRICREIKDDKLAASVLTNLGNVLRERRQLTESLAMHREALDINRKYEGEESWVVSFYWFGLGNTLGAKGDLQGCDEAFTRAVDIRRKVLTTRHPIMRHNLLWLADVRMRRREYARALELLLEAHRSLMQPDNDDPDNEWETLVSGKLARVYHSLGNEQETEHWGGIWTELMRARLAKLSGQIAGKMDDAVLFRSRAEVYSSLGELDKACSDLATAIHIDPSDPWQWVERSCLLAFGRDARAYLDNCRSMLERFAGNETRWIRQCAAKVCLIMPQSSVELKQITDVVDSATLPSGDFFLPWFQTTKALAEYRMSHYQQAIDWSTKARDLHYELEEKIQSELILAMASYKLGRIDQAQTALAHAADQIEKDLVHFGIGDINEVNNQNRFAVKGWLICHILLSEANDLILQQKPTTPLQRVP